MNDIIGSQPFFEVTIGDTQVTLLGTAHVSQTSADVVSELLESDAYDAVAIELCPSRHNALINPDVMAKMDLFQVIKEKKTSMVMANLALSSYQQRLAEEIGIEPGAEMKAAINVARDKHLPVILIDREIGTTLKRVYSNVPFWRRFTIFGGLLGSLVSKEKVSAEDIEKLKEGDMLETAFSHATPSEKEIFSPLIHERDEYMSARLQAEIQNSEHKRVLAVVGAGHLNGMNEILQTPADDPEGTVKRLDEIPPPSQWPKFIPWIVVCLVMIGFFIGFSRSPDLGWALVADWVLINGGLAAIGALIANAHPLTILSAFFAAPVTSLNPTIGAGMVTALIETYFRKPKVSDFASLRKDTAHLKGWWHNRVSRVFLVFFFCTLGSAMGTYIAGFRIFDKLT